MMASLLLAMLPLAACQTQTGQADAAASATLERSPAGLEQVPLTITGADRREYRFVVEVARSEAEQEQGLMNRDALAPDHGMIFPMTPVREASFWMKNTLIPLDLVFVRADGTIARIEENAVPLNLQPLMSGEPVAAVLEIAGGRSAQLGVKAGDRVGWKH
jgi:uncharacterized protein